jgi:hypothetical protein
MATAMVTAMEMAMAMMTAMAKVMARSTVMRTEMGGRWEAAACGRCSLAVSGSGNKEDNGETVTITNRATEMLQQRANQPACKRREAPADDGRRTRGGGNEWAG